MNATWVHSLWDRLIHKREFYDTINAPAEDVIAAIMKLKHKEDLFGITGTHVTIGPYNDGYPFRVHLYDRYANVVVSGRVHKMDASQCYWEGHIRDGMMSVVIWVMIFFHCVSVSAAIGISSIILRDWKMFLFACFWAVPGIFLSGISSIGCRRLRNQMTQILEQFNS